MKTFLPISPSKRLLFHHGVFAIPDIETEYFNAVCNRDMESLRIAQKRQCNRCVPPIDPLNRKDLPLFSCPPVKTSDRPNVIESQRIIRERCQQVIVNGTSRTIQGGVSAIYIPVESKKSSTTTSALKDAITAVEPRFYEFIKPRPLPPDFLQVARQVSNGGEPLAKNTPCALGEIKRVL